MTVGARPIHVPAGLAIDEVTRPELIETGTSNVQNRNVRNFEQGALEKRLGTASQSADRADGTLRTAGRKLFDHKGRLCVYDGDIIDELSASLSTAFPRNKLAEAHFTLRDLPSASFDSRVADIVLCNGFLVVLQSRQAAATLTDWEYTTCIVEAATGTVVRSLETVSYGAIHGVGLATFGTKVVLGIGNQTLSRIEFTVIDLASATTIEAGWSSLTTIAEPGTSGQLSMSSGTDRIYAAFDNGSNRVRVRAIDGTGVIQSKDFTTTAAPDTDTICLSEGGDVLWVGWNDGGGGSPGVNVVALNLTTITTVVGTQSVVFTASTGDLNALFIVATGTQLASIAMNNITLVGACQPKMHVRSLHISTGAVVAVSTYVPIANAEMTARPFTRGGRTYGWFTSFDGDTCVLADWTITSDIVWLRPVTAPVVRGVVDHPANRTNVHSRTVQLSATEMLFAFATKRTGISSGVLGVLLDFADREIGNGTPHHGVTFLSSGVTSVYDGDVVAEAGFLVAPPAPFPDTSVAGGVSLATGRNYVAIYSWTDAVGNVHLSGISPTSGLTGAITSKKIIVSVAGVALANERPIDVLVYATVDGGEPPYYLVGSAANDHQGVVTVTDNLDDATLATHAKLYAPQLPGTIGEALDRRAPAGLRNLVSYAGMLVGTVNDTLVFSGQEVSGEGTWFSPVFEVPVVGGAFTGLRAQDGYLVGFKQGEIYTVSGESPSDNGAAGGFGIPRLASADYGCIDSNSIVGTQFGVFFQSARGIEIFSRSQTIEWIGEPVVDTLDEYPSVTSAVVDGRSSLVRFTLARSFLDGVVREFHEGGEGDSDTGGGRDLVFDLSTKGWISVDDRSTNEAAQHATTIRFAGSTQNVYAWLGSNGVVHLERSRGEAKECRDDSTWVTSQYTPAAWRLGLQQDQRVFEMMPLFERVSSAGITIEVAEDYGAFGAITDDKVWTSAFLDARSTRSQVTLRTRDHGFATQLRLRDTEPDDDPGTDSGRGITWIGISADIGPKQGPNRSVPLIADEMRR